MVAVLVGGLECFGGGSMGFCEVTWNSDQTSHGGAALPLETMIIVCIFIGVDFNK